MLGLEADDGDAEAEEAMARVRAAEAALARLDELDARGLGARRHGRAAPRRVPVPDRPLLGADRPGRATAKIERRSLKYQRLRRELLDAERRAVVELRNAGEISDEVMRRVERDLDLEVSRLDY